MGKTRLEAFSDGVLAIIITIMVLEMHAPHGTDWASIKPLVPKFLSFGLSFLFIAIYWVNHHHLLHAVKRVTSPIMWANINLLFWLSLMPFATAWMGDNHFAGTTVAAYALLALICGAAFNILQAVIVSAHKSQATVYNIIRPTSWKSIGSLILYLLAIPIALFVNPTISGWLCLLVGLMWLVPDKKIEQAFKE
jgi:uncharacterized membrane protein